MEVENDIDNKFKKVEDLIYNYPLPLLNITNLKILEAIEDYLPYSCGMEFECFQKDNYNVSNFKNIPNIMEVIVDTSEQRYRIPKGLKGVICLYEICKEMKNNSALDLRSSNHYHFDFTDIENKDILCTNENKEFIISELINWKTALNLFHKDSWIKFFNSLGTLEIRIGEPTFDYNIIIKRLIQGCKISKIIKSKCNSEELKVIRLNNELTNLQTKIPTSTELTQEQIKEIIKQRRISNNGTR